MCCISLVYQHTKNSSSYKSEIRVGNMALTSECTYYVAFPITLKKLWIFTNSMYSGVSYDCRISFHFRKRHLAICHCNYDGLSSVQQELNIYVWDNKPLKLT